MIRYSMNVLEASKENGYTTYRLRKDMLMGEQTIQQIRNNQLVSWKSIDTICKLLNCQPGDFLQYEESEVEHQQEKAGE